MTDIKIDRILPSDEAAEIAVLGAMLQDKNACAMALDLLKNPKAFYKPKHEKIFLAVAELFDSSVAIDVITISNELVKRGQLDEIGGAYYLTELVFRVPSTENIEHYCQIVLEKYQLRQLIAMNIEINELAFSGREQSGEIVDKYTERLFDLDAGRRVEWKTLASASVDAIDQIGAALQTGKETLGFKTGFTELDGMTGGLFRSEHTVIAGRPGMGKTSFMMSLAKNLQLEKMTPIIFSLEMKNFMLALRMLSGESGINSYKFRVIKNISREEVKRLLLLLKDRMPEWEKIFMNDQSSLTPNQIISAIKRLLGKHKWIGNDFILFVDYLQIVDGNGIAGNREQEISYISASMKRIAKMFDVPVVSFSQLSRNVEQRGGDRRPILSDLRESGAIEQDADSVWFLFRESYYDKTKDPNKTEVIIAKARNGAVGTVPIHFDREHTVFKNPPANAEKDAWYNVTPF